MSGRKIFFSFELQSSSSSAASETKSKQQPELTFRVMKFQRQLAFLLLDSREKLLGRRSTMLMCVCSWRASVSWKTFPQKEMWRRRTAWWKASQRQIVPSSLIAVLLRRLLHHRTHSPRTMKFPAQPWLDERSQLEGEMRWKFSISGSTRNAW